MISHQEARKEAEQLVAKMTIDEKIGQINFRSPAIERLNISDYNYWNEGLHGVARAGVATVFPQAIGLASMFDEEQVGKVAQVIAEEGRAKYNQYHRYGDNDIYKGLTYWSPNINIFRDPRWGRGQETYGEDPYLTSRIGVCFIKGLQGTGKYLKLAACAKHFAVHSGPEADRHSFDARASKKDLYETYFPAFEAAVKEADVESFMGAYNAVDGVPACVNEFLLQEVLRQSWGFEGHVVSDYGALEDVYQHHKYVDSPEETMALAMKAGCNLCAGNCSDSLKEALKQGLVTEEEITQSVVSLYTTRVRLGMFATDNEYDSIAYDAIDSKEHQQLNLETAKKSIVLLKNDGYLPLAKESLHSVAVIGPNADSIQALQGNYFGTATNYVTFLRGIQENTLEDTRVFYSKGSHLYKTHAESSLSREFERESEALIAANHADCVFLCLGLDPTIEGEQGDAGNVYGSGDKTDVFLPTVQQRLLEKVISLGKPVVVILSAGSALSLNGLESHKNIRAIFHTWYPGSLGGQALAELIFGKESPSAKLPVTFYKNTNNLPDFSDYSLKNRTYRYIEEEPLYPFGYGLSYSPCSVSILSATKEKNGWKIRVNVKNEGDYDVEETVQVYAKTTSEFEVKNRRLVAFKKVKVKKREQETSEIFVENHQFSVVTDKGERINEWLNCTVHVSLMGVPSDAEVEALSNQTIVL